MKSNKLSGFLIALGALFITLAVLWAYHNVTLTRRAGEATQEVLIELYKQIPKVTYWAAEDFDGYGEPSEQPDFIVNPKMPMPVCEVNGIQYIGYLSVPALELDLSIASECDYETLDISPCRYSGSAYEGNLVISAHNYATHFGDIRYLQPGDPVTFTDMDGNVFSYRVAKQEILLPTESDVMTKGEYPLTLFTCTLGGNYRVTVRCEYVSDGNQLFPNT